ncbi:MAG: hypothetical protein ACFFC7_20955 [Candidatus Hermodarchaeota archaeon]
MSSESTALSQSPSLTVGTTGHIHVAWHDTTNYGGSGTDQDIFYKVWNVTLGIWTTTEVVSTESTSISSIPSLAVDTLGQVYAAWYDATNYGGSGTDYDIFYKRWNPTTGSWTTTEVVSTESTGISYYPSLAVDPTTHVHVAWYDLTDYAGAGTDWDIFYRKFAGVPPAPSLDPITPNPNTNGVIDLVWTEVIEATSYHVYRDTALITSVSGLTPIATVSTNWYTDTVTTDDRYYYAIVAENTMGTSDLSNSESVDVTIPTTEPTTTEEGIPGFLVVSVALALVIVLGVRVRRKRK